MSASSSDCDILIRNAKIVDGTGNRTFKGSIGIKGEKITAIRGPTWNTRSERQVDAGGLAVSPGFIDMHSHADLFILAYPLAENLVMQGVTTFVGGNCGYSPAPLRNICHFEHVLPIYEWANEIEPYKYTPPATLPLKKVNEKFKEKLGYEMDWQGFGQFLSRVKGIGISANYVPFVGHNTVRAAVMDNDYKRKARPSEIRRMEEHVTEAMECGVFGLTAGLEYLSGAFSDTDEIVRLARTVKKYDGLYLSHHRGVNSIRNRDKGVKEAIEICQRSGVPAHLSHLVSIYSISPPPPAQMLEMAARETLRTIDEARSKGLDVSFDVIPNPTSGCWMVSRLLDFLAPWLIETGSVENLVKNLRMRDFREDIIEAARTGKLSAGWTNFGEHMTVIECRQKKFKNKTLADIAFAKRKSVFDAVLDILTEDPDTRYRLDIVGMSEPEIKTFIKHPASMIGSDSTALDLNWSGNFPIRNSLLPHQNVYNVFARYFRRYVNELKVITLEEAVKKITFVPAQRLGLKDRGVLCEGAFADMVVFDPENIKDMGDDINPRLAPKGISCVLVNGTIVYENRKHTRARPGKVLRR